MVAAGLAALLAAEASCSRRPLLHRVEIRGFRFQPDSLVTARGDTIEWVNDDILPHTSTETGKQWDSGAIAVRGHWRWVASESGAFRYGCAFHPTMKAALLVR